MSTINYDQHKLLYELMTSEERYNNFINATSDSIFIHNLNGLILDANKAACDTLGYTRKELINSYAWEIEIAFTKATIEQYIVKLADGPINLEGCHRRKDGTTFPVDVRLSIYSNMGEQFILAVVRDITEQKRSQSIAQKLTQVLDQSPILIAIADREGVIEYINKRVLCETGYYDDEIIGQNSKSILPSIVSNETYQELSEQLSQGKKWQGKLNIKKKNGEDLSAQTTILPIDYNKDKEVSHYLALFEIP